MKIKVFLQSCTHLLIRNGYVCSGTSSGYGLITPWFFILWLASGCMRGQCGHNNEPSLDPKVPNERYGYPLSIGTLWSNFEQVVGSQWSGKVGCFLVFFMIPFSTGNLHSNPDFQIHTIQRWSHLKTWNQSLVILDIPNFNPMKEALWYSHPLLRYSIFRDGPRLYLQKKEWYVHVHIVRGPWSASMGMGH